MIYNKFGKLDISALGLGCMRFPTKGEAAEIDMDAAREMVAYAMKNGINYYDTAWGYHKGQSETVIGELLDEYPRESFYLASKFPGYDLANMGRVEEIFEAQLKKCRVEYFDFYLFHNVCEKNIDAYLDKKYGIFDYLIKQKQNGRIRHLGFSTHGSIATMKRFLDAYGEHMEFCQIQLNWFDYKFQNAKGKLEMLDALDIPVIVMEPVRGGKLAKLDAEYDSLLTACAPERSVPEWAFRFLQGLPHIITTLSGMSNMEQLRENIATFSQCRPLDAAELELLESVADKMITSTSLPCTDCKYCVTHCPMELDIPTTIELYNEFVYSNGGFLAPMRVGCLPEEKKPSACIGCRACEAVCPQGIRISEMMSDFAERLK